MLDAEQDASQVYGLASTMLMLPSATRILIVASPPPFTGMSTFMPMADTGSAAARLLKSLNIFPCAALARRWKAASLGRYTHAFPCAIFASAENLLSSHQSYDTMRLPRLTARSTLAKQLRTNMRPPPN